MSEDLAAAPLMIGPYRLARVLGRGAMSTVYLAEDIAERRRVALKLLRSELLTGAEGDTVLSRFQREAEIGMRLVHPNIVRTYGCGTVDGAPYLAMELVEGRELRDFLPNDDASPLTLTRTVAILRAVLDGLRYAHAQRIVHRDIKPANIMILADDTPKITDFGIARVEGSDLTQHGDLMGTPAFVAPEILADGKATPQSDLFSFGVMAYYLLTGVRPFNGSVASVMQKILHEEPPAPSSANAGIPPAFDKVLLWALAKRPDARPPDAEALSTALAQALGESHAGVRLVAAPAGGATEPVDMTLVPTARLLERLQQTLRAITAGPLSESGLAQVEATLTALLETAGDTPALASELADILTAQGIGPLPSLITQTMPADGHPIRGDFMRLVRLLAVLRNALHTLNLPQPAGQAVQQVAGHIINAILNYGERLTADLAADDNPDLMRLSAEFLRLEVLLLALEELGARAERLNAASTMAMLTGQVMRKINELLRRCTRDNDGFARFGVSVMLGEVEDLIDLAQRALDGGTLDIGDKAALSAFKADGQAQVREFVALAREFAGLSLGELRDSLSDAALTDDIFSAKLRPLGALYQFATRLPLTLVRDDIAALTRALHREMAQLTLDLARNTTVPNRAKAARLTAIYEMAEALHWREIAASSLTLLRRIDGAFAS